MNKPQEIRDKQRSEFEDVVEQLDGALKDARECGGVPDTLWDQIVEFETVRQLGKTYRRRVSKHKKGLKAAQGFARCNYLRKNRDAIAFESYAFLRTVRASAIYDVLRAARAREKGETDPRELKLAESISREALRRMEESTHDIRSLMGDLTREVGKVAESEDGSSLLVKVPSLTKKSRDVRESRKQQESQLLKVLEPLAESVHAVPPEVVAPDGVRPGGRGHQAVPEAASMASRRGRGTSWCGDRGEDPGR